MNILVLRALGIGDLATAVPALRGLRAAYPRARIDLVVPAWVAPLARLTAAVDSTVDIPGDRSGSALPAPRDDPDRPGLVPPGVPHADLAVNLHGRGPQSHRLLLRTQTHDEPGDQAGDQPGPVRPAPSHDPRRSRLLAFACPAAGHRDGPAWEAGEHEVRRWCRMLAWYGIHSDPDDLALAVPDEPAAVAGATVLHPGAKEPRRRWPPARFAAVARALEADGHKVVVSGSPSDVGLAARVARLAGLPEHRVLAGRTDVVALAALVAAARLVISGDTGVAHLATGYGTPSVVLFGPVPPAEWGPPPSRPWHQSLWRPAGPGASADPRTVDPGLLAVSVDDVLRAAGAASAHAADR